MLLAVDLSKGVKVLLYMKFEEYTFKLEHVLKCPFFFKIKFKIFLKIYQQFNVYIYSKFYQQYKYAHLS